MYTNATSTNELSRREISLMVIRALGLKSKNPITNGTRETMVHCPIHQGDKTPSCGINLDMGVYNCFACGSHGSIESMYKAVTGNSFYKDFNIQFNDPFSSFARNNYSRNYFNYNEDNFNLKNINIVYNPQDLIKATSNNDCLRYLRKRGISRDVADSLGFKYAKDTKINGKVYRERLIIPIYEGGKLISMEGRRLLDDVDEPKCIYPPNSSVNTLFNYDNLDKNKRLYITEGLMDMCVLRNLDIFYNSTTIFGASITKRQLHLLKEFKEVIYIPDLDIPGQKVLDKLKDLGNVWVLSPPKSIKGIPLKDIGDLVKTGTTIKDLVDHKWLNHIKKL